MTGTAAELEDALRLKKLQHQAIEEENKAASLANPKEVIDAASTECPHP